MKDIEKEFKPSSWAINNKTAVYVIVALITLLGLVSYFSMPRGRSSSTTMNTAE